MVGKLLTNVVALLVNQKAKAHEYGVSILNLPDFDYLAFTKIINSDRRVEIYFLGFDEGKVTNLSQNLPKLNNFTYFFTVEDAEKSRNTGDEDVFRILIIKRTEVAKLSSLRWFPEVNLENVYKKSCEYTLRKLSGSSNLVIDSLIKALSRRSIQNILSFERVIEYLEDLLKTNSSNLPSIVKSSYYKLGLCRDESLDTQNPNVNDFIKKIKRNHEIVERIGGLEQAERQGITNYYSNSDNDSEIPRLILQFYKTKNVELLKCMDLEKVEKCLKAAKKPVHHRRREGEIVTSTALAARLVFEDNTEQIESLLEQINDRVDNRSNLDKTERIDISFEGEKLQIKTEPTTEKISNDLVNEDDFGGIIKASVLSPSEAILNMAKYDYTKFDNIFLSKVKDILNRISLLLPTGENITQTLNAFLDSRTNIISSKKRLQDVPMLEVLYHKDKFVKYIDSYERLLHAINEDFPKIWGLSSSSAKAIINAIMSLDNIFIIDEEDEEICHAIPTCLNPLYLWKYVRLAEEIIANRGVSSVEECYLNEEDKNFIIRKSDDIPDPLSIMLLPNTVRERGAIFLPITGRIGTLPVYSTKRQIDQNESGIEILKQSIIRYLCLYPHAGLMLKITIIDPPSIETVVAMLKMLNKDKEFNFSGIDLSIYRTKETSAEWIEIEDESLNEGLLGKFKGKRSLKFNLRINNKKMSYSNIVKEIKNEQHVVIMFDPNEVKVNTAQNERRIHIHPLCIPKIYQYNPIDETVEIRPANEGDMFSVYASIVEKLNEHPSTFSHTSTFYNTPLKRETYEQIISKTDWLIILDQSLKNWDISLKAASEKLFYRENDYRSIGIYSKNSQKFIIGYNNLIKQLGNYIPQEQGVRNIIQAVRETNDDGLLSIVSHASNRIFDDKHGKGSLGLAISAIHYKINNPTSILVGLDSQMAREWLSDREDGKLPDLIGINLLSDNNAVIDIIEVKTYNDSANSFEIDGNSIYGHAIEQVTVLEELIKEIFGYTEKVTTVSRKEILREQVFECLFETNELDSRKKHLYSEKFNNLFAGSYNLLVNKHIVFVDFGHAESSIMKYQGKDQFAGNTYTLITIGSSEIQKIISGEQIVVNSNETQSVQPEVSYQEPIHIGSGQQDNIEGNSGPNGQSVQSMNSQITEQQNENVVDLNNVTTEPLQSERTQELPLSNNIDLEEKCSRLNKVLRDYGIQAERVTTDRVLEAARFTRFEVALKSGETFSNIERHKRDIGIQLMAAGDILIDHIRGTKYISIDIPFTGITRPISILEQLSLLDGMHGELNFVTGQKPDGRFEIFDLSKAPHLLVAGTTGSGKTIFLYSIIVSLLYQYSRDELELLIIDPKQTDFTFFEGLPHLYGGHVVTEAEEAIEMIKRINETDKVLRTTKLKENRCRDIESYNSKFPNDRMKRLVVIIDEYADLIQAAEAQNSRKEFEDLLCMLAQRVRNLGINLVIATQRPSSRIVTGTLKTNIPCRISFKLPSHTDSMTILDEPGAENLLGKGDMILKTENGIIRMQGLFITEEELSDFVEKHTGE